MSENFSPNNGSADAPKFTPAPPPQGAPVPPPMQGYQPNPSAALAITALVLGILAFLISFIPILGWLLGIGAVVCGAIGLSKIKKQLASGKGMANYWYRAGLYRVCCRMWVVHSWPYRLCSRCSLKVATFKV